MSLRSIPREKIPWFPRIDESACIGDKECINFCKNQVFEWDEMNNLPIVKNPFNCVLGCSACAQICPANAIIFPTLHELRETIRRLREETA